MLKYQRLLAGGLACLLLMPSAAFAASKDTAKDAAPKAVNVTVSRPVLPEKLPGKVNKKALREVKFQIAPAATEPLLDLPAPESVALLGQAEATPEQMAAFIKRRNPSPKLSCSVEELVGYYYEEAGREGIRPDVALCQALKETGFFAYGGDVVPQQNNFCGLGATGNKVKGAAFETARLGVRAHVQHLLAYASERRPSAPLADPRYELLRTARPDVFGQVQNWTGLNGIWAVPGTRYGQDILSLWQQAQAPDGSDISLAAAESKVQSRPKDAASYLYRGLVHQQRGNAKLAAKDFQQALSLSPKSLASYDLALLYMEQGENDKALKQFDSAIKAHPELHQAIYDRGLLRLQKGDAKKAAQDFEKVLALVPQQANALSNLALCQLQRGEYEKAWGSLCRAAAINDANMLVLANQLIFQACLQ